MCEAGDGSVVEESGHRVPVRSGLREPAGPLGHPVLDDVTVEERIKKRTAIMTPPAFCVQPGDGRYIIGGRLSILHPTMVADLRR